MKRKIILFSMVLIVFSAVVYGTDISITINADKSEVNRGGELIYTITIENTGSSSATELTLRNSLSQGLDQWNTTYRRDGGDWQNYPPNGLITLGTLAAGASTTIEIKTPVEISAPGTVSDDAQVIDPNGPLADKSLTVNVLPSVDAGADKMVGLGGTVDLDDAVAEDGGDGIASYSWSDNGGGGSFSNPNSLHPTYTAPDTSSLITLTLTVTDTQGGVSSDSLHLRVDAFPTVDAGADKTVDEGHSIALSDATADDSDGWIVSYQWSDGGAGGKFSPSAQVRNPIYTAPLTDNCSGMDITLTLTVTDDWGAQAHDSLNLHVRNVNAPPDVDAGSDQTVHPGDRVTLTGQADDPDGTITSYSWMQTAGPSVALQGKNSLTLSFTAPDVSDETVLRFRLTVTDNCGAEASDEVKVTVSPVHTPPPPATASISLDKAADHDKAGVGDRITYTYTVRNTGEATLYNVRLEDDQLGEIDLPTSTLAPGESVSATAATTVSADDLPGPLVNTASVTARTGDGRTVNAQASTQVELIPLGHAAVTIEIEALDSRGFPLSPLSRIEVGETVTYVYRITNTGQTRLLRISAVDDPLGPIPLDRTELDPWESTEGRLTRTITEDDLPGPIKDTGTVVAYDPAGNKVTDSETISLLEVAGERSLTLTKTVNTEEASVGDTLIYTYTIENTGKVTITDLVLTDDRLGNIPLPRNVLLPGESITVTVTYTVTEDDLPGPLTNHAYVTGQGPGGEVRSDESTVSVTINGVAGGGGAVSSASACNGKVIISEVAWAGTPADPDAEWIELENLGETPVDLTGWKIGWYPKGADPSDKDVWTWIDLSGVISPSPASPCANAHHRPHIVFVKEPGNDLAWKVIDMSWWVAGKDGNEGRGFYILERKSDDTVRDVAADLIYDAPLPDNGAVIELVNAHGTVVDTANAGDSPGWAAGNSHTKATMERTDPLGPDTSENWHTNPGILVYGTDSAGDRLAATAGKPNSPDLGTLISLAEEEVTPITPQGPISLTLNEGWKTRPWIKVAAVGITAAGAGGAAPRVTLSSEHGATGYNLQLDPRELPPGNYFIWITGAAGEAILVPVDVR